jgi:hypothetical protein
MTCFRANKFAQRDKEELEAAKKEIGELGGDAGKKIGAALRILKIASQHETEKINSLKEGKQTKQVKKEIYASVKTLDYYKRKQEAMELVQSIHKERKAEESLKAQIQEKTDRLAGIEKERKARADVMGEKRSQLKEKLEDLNNQIKKKGKIESLMKQKAEVERLIKEGPKEKETKTAKPVSPEEAALIKEISDLKSQVKESDWKKDAEREAAIRNYSARLDRTASVMERQLAENDFTRNRKYREKIETPEIKEKEAKILELKSKVRKAIAKLEYDNKTTAQRVADFVTDFKRFSILSSPKSIFKLTFASAEVALSRGLTETTGYALRSIPLIDKIASMAPIEGGRANEILNDTKAYWKGLIDGSKEFKAIVFDKTSSSLDLKFGKDSDVPQTWVGLWGRLHEAVKNPTRLANYNMAVERYLNWAERMGEDPSSAEIKNQAELSAFEYANDAIFKSDNAVVQIYNNSVSFFERLQGPAEIRYTGKAIAFALKQTLPIVKIPTNIIFQTFEYAFGTAPAGIRMANAVIKGLDKLQPEEADLIMRQLKRGSAGAVMMVIGGLFEEEIGGIYLTGEDKGDLEYGQIKFPWWDTPVPRNILENPLFACLQIGATANRFWKRHIDDDLPAYEKGAEFAYGAWKVMIGVGAEAPFVKSMLDVEKIIHSRDRLQDTFTEIYARPYIPAISQYAADLFDLEQPVNWDNWGDVINTVISPKANKRIPENPMQVMQGALPWLRNDIPLR